MDKKQEPLASLRERLTRYMEERAMRKTPERYEILRAAGLANGIFTIDGGSNELENEFLPFLDFLYPLGMLVRICHLFVPPFLELTLP